MGRAIVALVVVLGSATSWGADPPRPSPGQDLKTAQGRWQFDPKSGTLWDLDKPGKLPPLLRTLATDGAVFTVDGNRLTAGKDASVVIANDLPFLTQKQKQVESAVRGQRLVLLTLTDGKAVLASWNLDGQSIGIHYPAGCCSRSGNIFVFRRVKE